MLWDGTFEGALSATEAQAAATMQSAAALTRELKRVKAGSASGQTRELRRALEAAETLAAQLAEAARSLRAGYDFDEQAYLASGAYAKELLATAATAGVDMFEEDERLLCYPSLVRILSDPAAVEIDRKRERRLRPSVVVAVLAAAQRRGPRFRPEPFLDSLRTAYELVVARDGKKRRRCGPPDRHLGGADRAAGTGQGIHQAGVRPRPVPAGPERPHDDLAQQPPAALERQHRHQGRRRADHGHPRGPAAPLLGDRVLVPFPGRRGRLGGRLRVRGGRIADRGRLMRHGDTAARWRAAHRWGGPRRR